MSPTRAAAIAAIVALSFAAVLALVSRAPASVRRAEPGPRATDPAHGASFSDEQIARHGAYRMPAYVSVGLSTMLQICVLALLASGPFARAATLAERLPGGFAVHAAVLAAFVVIAGAVAALPLDFVRGFVMEHAWGLSTQDSGGWLSDRARSLLVGVVTSAIGAVVFLGVVRWQPRLWWIWGWAAFSLLTALLVFVWPVLVAPLFNRFTPLADEGLAARIRALATDAGVHVDEVLVADASRRTTAENAYVAGLGGTKRVVLYDTLLRAGDDDETLFIAAHELGHDVEGHVWKNVLLSSVGTLAGFIVLAWMAGRARPWSWGGAEGIADVRAIPVLLLFVVVAGLVALPLQNALSRRFEARADAIAIELTRDPPTAVRVFRRLAFSNLADLRPPAPAVFWLYTHPPIPDRIRAVLARMPAGARRAPGGGE